MSSFQVASTWRSTSSGAPRRACYRCIATTSKRRICRRDSNPAGCQNSGGRPPRRHRSFWTTSTIRPSRWRIWFAWSRPPWWAVIWLTRRVLLRSEPRRLVCDYGGQAWVRRRLPHLKDSIEEEGEGGGGGAGEEKYNIKTIKTNTFLGVNMAPLS